MKHLPYAWSINNFFRKAVQNNGRFYCLFDFIILFLNILYIV